MKVSFVVPTLNEEGGVGPSLEMIDGDQLRARGWTWEAVVIDGDSQDRTREEAEARGAQVIVEPRRGYGRAYKTGFAAATGDVVVTGDADGTYPFDRAHEYIDFLLRHDLDFVTCDRYARLEAGAMSVKHRVGNRVLSFTARALFGVRLRDSQSGMWVIRRSALDRLPVASMADGMAFSQEIKIEAFKRGDVAAAEIPGLLRPRIGRPVLVSWRDGFGNLKALLRKRLTTTWRGP